MKTGERRRKSTEPGIAGNVTATATATGAGWGELGKSGGLGGRGSGRSCKKMWVARCWGNRPECGSGE